EVVVALRRFEPGEYVLAAPERLVRGGGVLAAGGDGIGVREQPATCRVGEHVRGDRFGAGGGAFGRRAVEGGQQRPEPAVRRDGDRFAASHVLHRRGKVGERPLAI